MESVLPVILTSTENRFKDEDKRTNINTYVVQKKLGSGPFSKIKLAHNKNDSKYYAIKQYNKSVLKKKKELVKGKDGKTIYRDNFQDVLNEMRVMKQLNHENVITLHEVIDDPDSEKIYLVIDYCEKGQVIDWDDTNMKFFSCREEKVLSESEISRIMVQAVTGIEYLHGKGIVHRDIKPQNMLETSAGIIKLIDFDIAAINGKDLNINKTRGTLHFMSPEMCKKSLASGDEWKMCITSDIWALGVTLYCFIYQRLPFLEQSLIGLINCIENSPPPFLSAREISKELKDLLLKLLEKNPSKRIKLEDVRTHEWFKKQLVEKK